MFFQPVNVMFQLLLPYGVCQMALRHFKRVLFHIAASRHIGKLDFFIFSVPVDKRMMRDRIQPCFDRGMAPERLQARKSFQKRILCQVFRRLKLMGSPVQIVHDVMIIFPV